jgi:signal transduction histidine kinase
VSPSINQSPPETYFASAGRSTPEELQQEVEFCLQHPVIQIALKLVDSYVLVTNEHRQVVAANKSLLDSLASEDPSCFQGLRPGEILGCTHVQEGPDGCGTSKACVRCGAALALLASQSLNEPVTRECLLECYTSDQWQMCEFRVRATPLGLDSQSLTVAVLQDIGAEKRSKQMEGIFLHDLRNTIQGLCGWSEVLTDSNYDPKMVAERINGLLETLSDEIRQHQMLLKAERSELKLQMESVSVVHQFEALESTLAHHPAIEDHRLVFTAVPESEKVEVDVLVLRRILTNMILNALEATPPDGSVRVWFERRGDRACFFVQNPGCIPESIKPRIFHRSFSTKGRSGRGLGTYSMKFLGENVFGGEVDFVSTVEEGTCFHFFLPSSGN